MNTETGRGKGLSPFLRVRTNGNGSDTRRYDCRYSPIFSARVW